MDAKRFSSSTTRALEIPAQTARNSDEYMFPKVAGIVIEAEGILFDTQLWRQWLVRLLSRLGVETHFDTFCCRWDAEFRADVCTGRQSMNDALASYLSACGLSAASIDEILAALRAQMRQLTADPRLIPGVHRALTMVKELGYVLAVSADLQWTSAMLVQKLVRLNLEHCFNSVITSVDVGHIKPEVAAYQAIARSLGLAPIQIAFVGSNSAHLAGAKDQGMATIALNCDSYADPDLRVARLDEIAGTLPPRVSQRKPAA